VWKPLLVTKSYFQILDLMLAEDGIANTYGNLLFCRWYNSISNSYIDAQLNYNLPSLKSTLKLVLQILARIRSSIRAGLIGQQYFASWTINP
jgi:hypothetical protein